MGEGAAGGAGQFDPLQHTVMNQAVMQDEVPRFKQRADSIDIGSVTTDKNDAIVHAVDGGKLLSSSRCMGRSPATRRLAPTDVP